MPFKDNSFVPHFLRSPASHARLARLRRLSSPALLAGAALALSALGASTAQAQPGWGGHGWGGPGWGGPGWGDPFWGGPMASPSRRRGKDPREGRVHVSRFVRDDAEAARLGHGYITVTTRNTDNKSTSWQAPTGQRPDWIAPERRARFEAAIENSLIDAGYNTLGNPGPDSQVAVLAIRQRVLVPAEEKRNPVSGSAAMSVGTYGQSYGLALNIDLTKPHTALISTRLDLRILDHADGHVLWEGNAEIATYEGDNDWTDDKIATRLAEALLDRFPDGEPVTVPVTEVGISHHPEALPETSAPGDTDAKAATMSETVSGTDPETDNASSIDGSGVPDDATTDTQTDAQ